MSTVHGGPRSLYPSFNLLSSSRHPFLLAGISFHFCPALLSWLTLPSLRLSLSLHPFSSFTAHLPLLGPGSRQIDAQDGCVSVLQGCFVLFFSSEDPWSPNIRPERAAPSALSPSPQTGTEVAPNRAVGDPQLWVSALFHTKKNQMDRSLLKVRQ